MQLPNEGPSESPFREGGAAGQTKKRRPVSCSRGQISHAALLLLVCQRNALQGDPMTVPQLLLSFSCPRGVSMLSPLVGPFASDIRLPLFRVRSPEFLRRLLAPS